MQVAQLGQKLQQTGPAGLALRQAVGRQHIGPDQPVERGLLRRLRSADAAVERRKGGVGEGLEVGVQQPALAENEIARNEPHEAVEVRPPRFVDGGLGVHEQHALAGALKLALDRAARLDRRPRQRERPFDVILPVPRVSPAREAAVPHLAVEADGGLRLVDQRDRLDARAVALERGRRETGEIVRPFRIEIVAPGRDGAPCGVRHPEAVLDAEMVDVEAQIEAGLRQIGDERVVLRPARRLIEIDLMVREPDPDVHEPEALHFRDQLRPLVRIEQALIPERVPAVALVPGERVRGLDPAPQQAVRSVPADHRGIERDGGVGARLLARRQLAADPGGQLERDGRAEVLRVVADRDRVDLELLLRGPVDQPGLLRHRGRHAEAGQKPACGDARKDRPCPRQ